MAWPPLSSRSQPASCSLRRHRRRKQSLSPPSVLSPSSTLLSFLAALVSASATNASPTPPTFLCPSIGSDSTIPTWCHNKRSPPLGKAADNNSHHRQDSGRSKLRRIPDRFMEGADGIWRRVESYTLYGVTTPNSNCGDESCPPTRSTGPLNATSLTPRPVDIQLPPGWTAGPTKTNGRTTTILAVSLALSLFICFLIILCLFWRKGLFSKKKRSQDVEAKHWRRNNPTSEEHRKIEVEKEAKVLQKIWARASARWKANARYSLRQRTGKRLFARSHHQSTLTVDDSRSNLATHISRPPSIRSAPNPNHNNEPLEGRPSIQERQIPTSRPSSPPAYQTDHQIPPIIISPDQTTDSTSPLPRRHSRLTLYPSNTYTYLPDLDLFPAAHVATDDKTMLARLADLASAPPNETDDVANMPLTEVPAPEDLDFGGSPASIQMDGPPPVPLFPLPPSKERLAAAERLEYTFVYDNLENTEPEPEPSAPPFEENSTNQSMPFPSAPPAIYDEEDPALWRPPAAYHPSAPALEDVLPSAYEENISEQYHDQASTNTQ